MIFIKKKYNFKFVFFYSEEKDKYLEIFKKMIIEKIENSISMIEGIKR